MLSSAYGCILLLCYRQLVRKCFSEMSGRKKHSAEQVNACSAIAIRMDIEKLKVIAQREFDIARQYVTSVSRSTYSARIAFRQLQFIRGIIDRQLQAQVVDVNQHAEVELVVAIQFVGVGIVAVAIADQTPGAVKRCADAVGKLHQVTRCQT